MAMETSTPLIINKNLQIGGAPRRGSFGAQSPFVQLETQDDAKERERRRSEALVQKRLSSIPQQGTSLNDSISASDEDMIQHMQICLKLFAENKINTKNAWTLKIIDYLPKIKDSLQNAGTSLDVSAKVYGIRVDDVHAEGMKLANMMAQIGNNPAEHDNLDADEDESNKENEAPKKKKKVKQIKPGQKNTITKDGKALTESVTKLSAQYFQINSVLKLSAIDSLFTSRFPLDRTGYRLLFHEKENAWPLSKDGDKIVQTETPEMQLPLDIPPLPEFKICSPFSDFDVAKWNADEEDKLFSETQNSERLENDILVFDEQGFPVAELDGSVHNIFDQPHVDDDSPMENQDQILEEEEFAGHVQGNIAYVVDFKQHNDIRGSEYSYNSLISTQSGKTIEQIWAGPSHWKLKFIKPATVRFSGQVDKQTVQRQRRKEKVQEQPLDFMVEVPEIDFSKQVKTRKINNAEVSKITLPLLCELHFEAKHDRITLLLKPTVVTSDKNNVNQESECEVSPYNYENLNDSQYCSQKSVHEDNDDNHDDDDFNDANDNPNGDYPVDFVGDNLIQQPEMVTNDYIQYARFAKKIDMKKLKTVIWKCITEEDKEKTPTRNGKTNEPTVKPTTFSAIYKRLPDHMSAKMKADLSCPLTFFALLHLANEHDLDLQGQPDLKDIYIANAKSPA